MEIQIHLYDTFILFFEPLYSSKTLNLNFIFVQFILLVDYALL